MKLVFPNGEYGQVLLHHGANRIGSASDNAAVLTQAGISPLHCVIHLTNAGANLQIPEGAGPVSLNGKPVNDLIALRPGDTIGIGPVIARFTVVEAVRSVEAANAAEEDSGATRVRMAVPKFLLRGVSGAVFGKVFPVTSPVVIGRAAECDISVPGDEISRRHVQVNPTLNGLSVEDLGSSNGTYINDKRVQHGFLNPGDELRLDAVRFILVAPGRELASAAPAAQPVRSSVVASQNNTNRMQMWASILLTLAALVVIVLLITKR